ncbi:MAG TPA: hypothetical protein VEI81_02505 [Methanoregula sp.]|nr:hypothetical protein [Methanoregula sp.]
MWSEDEINPKKDLYWFWIGIFLLLCGIAGDLWVFFGILHGILPDDKRIVKSYGVRYNNIVFLFIFVLAPGLAVTGAAMNPSQDGFIARFPRSLGWLVLTLGLTGIIFFVYSLKSILS